MRPKLNLIWGGKSAPKEEEAPKELVTPKTFRTISVKTSMFRLGNPRNGDRVCAICKKEGPILSGLPQTLTVTLPLTEDEHRTVSEKVFWIAGDFEIECTKGFAHRVKGLKRGGKWVVSSDQTIKTGIYEEHEQFEHALANFIPRFQKLIAEQRRFKDERLMGYIGE